VCRVAGRVDERMEVRVEARMEVRVMGSVEVRMEARMEAKVWGSRVKFRVLLHRPTRLRWVWVSWGCL
jgi:hypothetical protein